MSFIQKRRATKEELTWVCAQANLDPEEVAEAWVTDGGNVEIVMRGFIDKIKITATIDVATEESA